MTDNVDVDTIAAMGSEYKHALEHVATCSGTCHDCQRLARSALAHENLADHKLQANSFFFDIVEALAFKVGALLVEQARMRTVVTGACGDLNDLAERTGNGDIGVVVERLIDELGLTYPLPAETP